MNPRCAAVVLACALPLGCDSKRKYESVCQIVRQQVVESDSAGVALQVDVELEWDPCPGEQFQVIRGGRDFAACMARYNFGDYVPVQVLHWRDGTDRLRWDVVQIGQCASPLEEFSEGSYEKSQECRSVSAHGHTSGFACSRRPFRNLVEICPWMSRD